MRLLVEELDMPQLGRRRTVRVLLPADYEEAPSRRYPVLYMQDGHNLFDPGTASFGETWKIRENLHALAAGGRAFPCIVVGVDCNREGEKRLDEYSPWVNPRIGEQISRAGGLERAGGEGEAYLAFLAESLLPWTAARFRVLPGPAGAAVAGSSMGALISLYAGLSRPGLFGAVGAFSPATWFAREEILSFVARRVPALGPAAPAVYVDIGTAETSDASKPEFARRYEEDARELAATLARAGLPAERLRLVVEEGADHSERSWARRFPGFLEWLRPLLAPAS